MSTFDPSPEQTRILEHPLTSLRVAAGAGTGKTSTVAERVVRLVTDHGLEPEQILGVTFTNKAAQELSERIRESIRGLVEGGREIEIHTYHGLAGQLLREHGSLVGVERGTQLVTPTFSRQMMRSIMLVSEFDHFDPTNPYAVEPVRALASALADNLLTPADVPLPDHPDGVWLRRSDLLGVITVYEREKQRLGVADHGDLIYKAHLLVTRHPEVAEVVRNRYRAVVLDEYQDTNPAQRELLRTLFADAVPVMAVGDTDQTIYEWRGASLENFDSFPVHFPVGGIAAPTLPLTNNRRSGAAILDVANALRSQIDDRPRDPLTPLQGTPDGSVRSAWLGTAVDEAAWIAGEILELHDQGHAWSDMAVLFRKNKDMLAVHDALARHDIPFEVANLGGLLSVPEVADLHAWLRVLDRPEDGPALARLLLGPRFRLGLGDLTCLSRWVRHRQDALDEDDDDLPGYTLLEAVDHLDEIPALRPEAAGALRQFHIEYRQLLEAAQGLSLVELCRTALDVTGAWADLAAMNEAPGLSARLNLFRFLDLAENWSPLEGRPSLPAFLEFLDTMREDPAEELDTARLSDADAVTIITVHRAKGLEWPVVFLPALAEGTFPSGTRYENPLTKAEVLPFDLRLDAASLPVLDASMTEQQQKEILRPRHLKQEWRLAYVAATRAKRLLYVSGAWWYGHPHPTKRPAKPSELFQLVDGHARCRRVVETPEAPPRPDALGYRVEVMPAPDPLLEGSWPAVLRAAGADPTWTRSHAAQLGVVAAYDDAVVEFQQTLFRLPEPPQPAAAALVETSATGLVTYAICPKRFFWTDIDRLPRRVGSAARRGIDVHRRIELHNLGMIPLEEIDETTYDVVDPVEPRTDPFAAFRASRFADIRPLLVEAPFDLSVGDVRVRGRIDAVYAEGDRWEIVDFKSGRRKDDPARLVQLETYAVAISDVPLAASKPAEISATFAYLGGAGVEEETHHVDEAWLDGARSHLSLLTAGIAHKSWDPTPSPACGSCDFLRFCPEGREHVGNS